MWGTKTSKFHDFLIFGPIINGLFGLFMAYLWLIMAYLWLIMAYYGLLLINGLLINIIFG